MGTPEDTVLYRILGPLAVADGSGQPVPLPGALPRRLVAALLLEAGRVVPSDVLADRLWGEALPGDVAGALQTHVSRTRRLLPDAGWVTADGGYRLDVPLDHIDSHRFDRLVGEGLDLRAADAEAALGAFDAALALWRGPALAEFADWDDARAEASRLDERRVRAAEERADVLLALGRHDEALADLRGLVAEHPLRERARSLLLLALYRCGRQPEALRAYEAYRVLLADELGLAPSPALRDLERAILDHTVSPGPAGPPGSPGRVGAVAPSLPATPATPAAEPRDPRGDDPVDLPRPANRLIGRHPALAELTDLVAAHRVVTLSGPGGMGKTRLALELAWSVARTGRRVAFCELAALGPGDDVAPAVASALGIEALAGAASATGDGGLARALRGQDLLLVLDNCEHVIDAAAALTERLVAGTAAVSVLATSRERLAVAGERVHTLAPLADDDAVDLFVERARAVRTGFEADEGNHGDLLYICHRLDGLPLALELAAARAQALSVRGIADALSQRFRLLTGGRRTEQRHRSLLEAVRWSFELLNDDERELCEQLAVFVGGCTVGSVAAVTGRDPVTTAELLARLVERSLVTAGPPAAGRFGMLETVRQYGSDRLAERQALAPTRRAHARHFVGWAREQQQAMGDPDRAGAVLGRIDDELANLRAAHAWLAEVPDPDGVADLHVALHWFALLAFRPEICTWAEADLAAVPPDHARRSDLLATAALGRWQRGDRAGAWQAVDEGLALAPAGSWARRTLISHQGNLTGRAGNVAEAIALFDEVTRLAVGGGDPMIGGLNRFQRLLYGALAGEPAVVDEAEHWAAEAEAVGNPLLTCWARYAAGEVVGDADPDRARRHIDAALHLALDSGCWFVAGVAGVTSASLEARHGDPGRAAASYRQLLDLWRRGALRPIESTMLRGVAELLAATGHADTAALLHGAVTSSTVAPVFGPDAERQAELAQRLRAQLGAGAFTAAVERGGQLGDDEVLALTAAVLGDIA